MAYKVRDKSEYTKKVILYLDKNRDIVLYYFIYCTNNLKKPNYSEMCRLYFKGCTIYNGVFFENSTLIDRSAVTLWLKQEFSRYLSI